MVSNEEDEVIAEAPIIILSVGDETSVNRLQFQNGAPTHFEECAAQWKKKVRQLKLEVPMVKKANSTVFSGEGYSNPDIVNNAVGFFKDGRLYIIPIRDIYDMQFVIPERKKIEKTEDSDEMEDEKMAVPLRTKFSRPETDFQKRRREQSALHKQKMHDEDVWIPLRVEEKEPAAMYSTEIENSKMKTPFPATNQKTPLDRLV